LSSAILYLAIVAIWACVLIPRWLKRDSAHTALLSAEHATPHQDAGLPADTADTADTDSGAGSGSGAGAGAGASTQPDEAPAPAARHPRRAAEPVTPQEARHRMLAARRRLLVMLIGLEIAAIVLALLGLAALWVVVPPSIMLAGYLLLLREAAQADREQAAREAEAEARRLARDRARARQAGRAAPGTAETAEPQSAAELTAQFAAAPVAADYEDSAPGRDFAPGLAGKYTTATAQAGPAADEDHYHGYEAPRLRAVGD
jgi:hypothetical protein